jgi:hypothetical protein
MVARSRVAAASCAGVSPVFGNWDTASIAAASPLACGPAAAASRAAAACNGADTALGTPLSPIVRHSWHAVTADAVVATLWGAPLELPGAEICWPIGAVLEAVVGVVGVVGAAAVTAFVEDALCGSAFDDVLALEHPVTASVASNAPPVRKAIRRRSERRMNTRSDVRSTLCPI